MTLVLAICAISIGLLSLAMSVVLAARSGARRARRRGGDITERIRAYGATYGGGGYTSNQPSAMLSERTVQRVFLDESLGLHKDDAS